MAEPELRYLTELRRQFPQRPSPLQALDRPDLSLRRATRPDEVRVIGVRQPVGPRLRRSHHALLLEGEHGVARTRRGERVRDRPQPFGVGDRVPAALEHIQPHTEPLAH